MTASVSEVGETGSTNDDLAALAAAGAVEGTWLRADRQFGGRGRQGRVWQSPVGNLHASTLVRVAPTDPPAPTLALVAAVALHEALRLAAPDAPTRIKWPNDLVADRAKLGGILLERAGDSVVIGFGVNLAHHPRDLDRPTTDLATLAGRAPDAPAFCAMLADILALELYRWRSDGLAPLRTRWLSRAHPIGTALATSDGEGVFDGLDEAGALRLRLADGSTRLIHAGDVFLI